MDGPEAQFEGHQQWYRDREGLIKTVAEAGTVAINAGSCDMRDLRDLCADRGWSLEHECAEIWTVSTD